MHPSARSCGSQTFLIPQKSMANIAPHVFNVRNYRGMTAEMAQAYSDIFQKQGVTHALTISPKTNAAAFDRRTLDEVMTRLVREASHRLRLMSRRQIKQVGPDHPDVLFVAGFVESQMRSGAPFIHWHGGVALRGAEEIALRELLRTRVGDDIDNPPTPHEPTQITNPLSPNKRTPLTFHLQRLTTAPKFISYSNKHAIDADFDFCSTNHFLAR